MVPPSCYPEVSEKREHTVTLDTGKKSCREVDSRTEGTLTPAKAENNTSTICPVRRDRLPMNFEAVVLEKGE